MGWIRRLWTTVHRGLFRHAQADRDLDDELRFHLAQETQLLVDRGASPEDARRAARRSFGSFDVVKEQCRDSLGLTLVDNLQQDVWYSLRTMARNRSFAVVAIATIAL